MSSGAGTGNTTGAPDWVIKSQFIGRISLKPSFFDADSSPRQRQSALPLVNTGKHKMEAKKNDTFRELD